MMKNSHWLVVVIGITLVLGMSSCTPPAPVPKDSGALQVLAAETFIADIAQNVAGDRLQVASLIPAGVDPHTFVPTPRDVARIAGSQVFIINGAGFEKDWLQKTLDNAGGQRLLIEAAKGLVSRKPTGGEIPDAENPIDPHFWTDPTQVIHYVENIRDGLTQVDPTGKDVYAKNAADYIQKLNDLDAWIISNVAQVPAEKRLLVTNHESLGYFADRYGFKIIGTIVPSTSTEAAPSAKEIAGLIDQIRASKAPAIFLEAGANPELAQQIAQETGVKVVTDLLTHWVTPPGGPAPDYLSMMKYNTRAIVDALK